MQIPQMSVVLIVGKQRGRAARCLQSILAQSNIDQLEVLLLDNEMEREAPLAGSDHPCVRAMPTPAGVSYGEAMVYGLEQARAPVVAFIEEHCRAWPGWAEALIQAHQGPYAVVSGEVHNGNAGHGASDLVFNSFWGVAAPRARGETVFTIAHNSSFKREFILRYQRGELVDLFQADLFLNRRLRQDGYTFFAEPAAKFEHANETYYSSHRVAIYYLSRIFGAARVRLYHWSVMRRTLYLLVAPLIPWIRLARQIAEMRSKYPDRIQLNLHTLFHLWAFHVMGVAGQTVGLIWGSGDAGVRFMQFETDEYRYIEGVEVLRLFARIR